jgi:hypothetical protein
VGIAAIYNDVTLLQVGQQILQHRIYDRTCGNQHDHHFRRTQQSNELPYILASPYMTDGALGKKGVHPVGVFVVSCHCMSLIGHIQKEVAPHHS